MDGPGETNCNPDHPTDLPARADLGLLPLDHYGGPTPTHALESTSAAVDRALDASCPGTAQRGELRPFDGDRDGLAQCDAGAVEYRGALDIPTLSSVAVLLLAGLLAAAGLAAIRSSGVHAVKPGPAAGRRRR